MLVMKKERCKICGEQLTNGVCPKCGGQQRYPSASTEKPTAIIPKKRTNSSKIVWGTVCVALILLPWLMNTSPFQSLIYNVRQQQVMTAIPTSTYENVTRELPAEGEAIELTLDRGNYIVGIDIPEGIYQISVVDSTANIQLEDNINQIHLFSVLSDDSGTLSSYLQDVRLYNGATLQVETGEILFASSHAQVDALQALPQNEDTNTYYVSNGAVAGVDFPVGTYDITACGGGDGTVDVSFPENSRDALGFSSTMENDADKGARFRNVEFPKGTLLEMSEVEIALVPSTRNSLVR